MPIFAIDIETQTQVPASYPPIVHQIKDFGLSVLAPITHVAIYEKDSEAIVIDMTDWNSWEDKRGDETKWQKIRQYLDDPEAMIIGHNVIFDLRHLITHYNYWHPKNKFYIPLGAKVWDTQVIALRMLLGEQPSARSRASGFGDSFALAGGLDKKGNPYHGMAERFGLLDPKSAFWRFYTWMKTQRDNLSNMPETLAALPEEHAVWDFLGGYTPPNRLDLLRKAADKLLKEYVSRDAILSYQLYEKELEIAKQLAKSDFHLDHIHIPRWPELTQRDINENFDSLLDFWTRRLRINANRAGRGLKLNKRHVKEQKQKASMLIKEKREEVLAQPDQHDPYPEFERVFSMVMYYKMVLDCGRGTSGYNHPKHWAFWERIDISPTVIKDAITTKMPDAAKDIWVDWLLTLSGEEYANKTQVMESLPAADPPEIDLEDWVYRNCYIGYEEVLGRFLASVKCDWLSYYYRRRISDLRAKTKDWFEKHPDKSEENPTYIGRKLFHENIVNSRIWVAYYMFCVATAPLPGHEEFKFEQDLTTQKFKKLLSAFRRAHNAEPENFQHFAIANKGLSYGKNAMRYFLESEHYDTPLLEPLRDLMQARADLTKFKEFEQHAALDGAVHSIIINAAKSGRCTSNNPNLQNIKMASKPWEPPTPFPGTFRAPLNMTLTEWDYSNAEVRMGNMIGQDDAAAAATEGNDRHAALAEIYTGSQKWATYDDAEKKKWRNEYKRVTFGSEYGAGAYKVALMIKTTMERAEEILENKKRAFWKIEEKKRQTSDNARKRLAAGCVPVYVTLWSRERCQVDRVKFGKKIDCVAYTGWNSLQQGGVTAMISRADVLIAEMLERENYKTFIQQDVHDSLIIAFDHEEFEADNYALPTRIAQMMGSIMPEEYCERTTPKTHFVTNLGPENAKKWGYNPHRDYALRTDIFINQWGVFPTTQTEAPTWIGPEHKGWTLEAETKELTMRRQVHEELEQTGGVVGSIAADDSQIWLDLQTKLVTHPAPSPLVQRLLMPMELVHKNKDDKLVSLGHFTFAAWMAASRRLYHNGNGSLYTEMLSKIQAIVAETPEHFSDWQAKHEDVLCIAG